MKIMYSVGDKIAHPMHGAGIISDIVEERVDGEARSYYVMRMTCGTMTVMIPCLLCDEIGVRKIINCAQADEILSCFPDIETDETQNWSRRYRENMIRIKSGDLLQVSSVVKSLIARDQEKGLSTGERKLLNSAKQILISELMLAKNVSYAETEHIINRMLNIV